MYKPCDVPRVARVRADWRRCAGAARARRASAAWTPAPSATSYTDQHSALLVTWAVPYRHAHVRSAPASSDSHPEHF